MKVIIGSYRGPALVRRAIGSLGEFLTGFGELVIMDDSGRPEWLEELQAMPFSPKVIQLPRVGYGKAMQAVLDEAAGERFMFWEEDFTLEVETDLRELSYIMDLDRNLAQVALQRQAWFPNEVAAGSMLEGLKQRVTSAVFREEPNLSGLIVHDATFTCNPAVWRENLISKWPQVRWSENKVTENLIDQGYTFGFMPGVRVHHDGERTGHGY